MDAQHLGIGTILEHDRPRDAIHVAIIPVVAADEICPGERVKLEDGKARACKLAKDTIGVADPFLRRNVLPEQRFWLFLNPGSIVGLRHQWVHPALPAEGEDPRKPASEKWLRERAERACMSYEDVLAGAIGGDGHGGDDYARELPREPDFWLHIAVVTGMTFTDNHRENTFFSCAC